MTLSNDAKAVAGAWFGLMHPGKGNVTLHMRESKPTPRTQAAIDELIAAGVIKVERLNSYGGLIYSPLQDCMPFMRWLAKHKKAGQFEMMEPKYQKPILSAGKIG